MGGPEYPQVRLETVIHWITVGIHSILLLEVPQQLQTWLRLWPGLACRLTTVTDNPTLKESAWKKNAFSTQK